MTRPFLPIRTKRLTLRAFGETDLEGLAAYRLQPDLSRYLDMPARDRRDCAQVLKRLMDQTALLRPGDWLTLAIERSADKAMIGEVHLGWTDGVAAQGRLNCIVNPDFAGHRYGTEAMEAVVRLGFGFYNLHRIFARCDARNGPAARALEALGMRCEAHFIEHGFYRGEWDEELHYAILNREWNRLAS